MIDLGQILVIAVFAIVLLGPQKTLQLAFSAGRLWAKAQSYLGKIKAEIELDGSSAKSAVNDFKHLAKTVKTPLKNAVNTNHFTASYPPAALSSNDLQEEIEDLKQELQRLKHRNKKVITKAVKVRRRLCRRISKA